MERELCPPVSVDASKTSSKVFPLIASLQNAEVTDSRSVPSSSLSESAPKQCDDAVFVINHISMLAVRTQTPFAVSSRKLEGAGLPSKGPAGDEDNLPTSIYPSHSEEERVEKWSGLHLSERSISSQLIDKSMQGRTFVPLKDCNHQKLEKLQQSKAGEAPAVTFSSFAHYLTPFD